MTAAAGGIFQTFANGWNAFTLNVSRTYNATCDLTRAGWQRLMQFEAVQKTVNLASPYINKGTDLCKAYYPNAFKFQWSTGTAVTTTIGLFVVGGILKARQSEESKLDEQISTLEAKRTMLENRAPKEHLTVGEALLLTSYQIRKNEIRAAH
ncbi:MAG: hypothetical protein AB7N99_08545 [Simkaniaceae bacterium]